MEKCAQPISAAPAARYSRLPPADFFSFFGLPRKLEIDTAALQRDFYELSRKLHPDVYVRIGGQEQQWS